MIHTQTTITCDHSLCESWTLPDDLVGWQINQLGDVLCEKHAVVPIIVEDTIVWPGFDPVHHFPPPTTPVVHD